MKKFKVTLGRGITVFVMICLAFMPFYNTGCKKISPPIDNDDSVWDLRNSYVTSGISLLANDGFESDLEGNWSWAMPEFTEGRIIEHEGVNATRGAVIELRRDHQFENLYQRIAWNNQSKYVLVTGWIKSVDLSGTASLGVECVSPDIQYDEAGKEIYGVLASRYLPTITGTTDWTQIIHVLEVPVQTKEISVYPGVRGTSGKVIFDDVNLYAITIAQSNNEKKE